jgi:hypothetical protein
MWVRVDDTKIAISHGSRQHVAVPQRQATAPPSSDDFAVEAARWMSGYACDIRRINPSEAP